MKKFLLLMTILAGALSFTACSDDDNSSSGGGENSDREFMTMFRKAHNTNSSDDDPYICQVVNGSGLGEKGADDNAIHWYWYAVNGCKGYQIRVALQPNVSGGPNAWQDSYEKGKLVLDTIVGPEVTDLIMKDLQYNTEYRGSIRVLSTKDADGDYTHASKWYGHGDGRQWAEYLGITTKERYDIPEVIATAGDDIQKTSFRVNLTPKLSEFTETANETYKEYFTTTTGADGDERYKFDVLTLEASGTNPDATVPSQWEKYKITDADYARGYIEIDGLDQNSVYTVNVVDEDKEKEECHWDAIYNTLSVRTSGDVGDPILIEHKIAEPQRSDYTYDSDYEEAEIEYQGMVEYDACRIDTILSNFNSDNTLAEGQVFYLEGGKNYVLFNNADLCKGLKLATNPKDIAAGKGRAKVFLGGISRQDGAVKAMNFMFGRQPDAGELGNIYIKSLIFENLDFDSPTSPHYDPVNGTTGQGNYFINMYSNGMAVTLESFEVRDCTFERVGIRGFMRVQGSNRRTFEKVLFENNEFYNCGYYDSKGSGYNWIHEENKIAKANIFVNCIFQNNTIYDCPHGSFFTNNNSTKDWGAEVIYNVTFNNNTIINFDTRNTDYNLFNFRYIPGGSTITCENNFFALAKQSGDSRKMYFQGMDIRTVTGGDGSGKITYNIRNNWSTNNNLTKGQIFTAQAFSATKNSAGKNPKWCTYGKDELEVHAADISNEDLMYDPNPPYTDDVYMHSTAYLDGSGNVSEINKSLGITKGVNLYFKNFDNDIYKNNVGASKWREGK